MPFADKSSPAAKYSQHKANAFSRGIPFCMSFEEWWNLWEPHWTNRGKGAGKMVMARFGDSGPYKIGNVRITSQEVNGAEKAINGVVSRGEHRWSAKLVTEDIPRIRDMLSMRVPKLHIAKYFGVSRNAIRQIADGCTWKWA